jgi:hypothetical protein
MKNLAMLTASLVFCSAPTFAQAPDSADRPAQTPDSSSSKPAEDSARASGSSRSTTLVGCVAEQNGKYLLATQEQLAAKSGQPAEASSVPATVELLGTQDMKAHVGHKIRVTGKIENSTSATDAVSARATTPDSNSTAAPEGDAGNGKQAATTSTSDKLRVTLRVANIQMISRSCAAKADKTSP